MIRRKVLVADDDPQVVASVRGHLEKDGYRVFAARNGTEFFNIIRRRRPDVLVVAQSWLESDGFDLASLRQSDSPVIVLTTNSHDGEMELPTGSGMTGRIARPVDRREVLSRVREALYRAGRAPAEGPEQIHCADIVINQRRHEVRVRGEAVYLTPTEFKLLEVLAGEPGRAFTRLELLPRVFGYDYEGLERTVDTHVKNLRKKIEPDPADPTYVKTVYGIGYKFAEE